MYLLSLFYFSLSAFSAISHHPWGNCGHEMLAFSKASVHEGAGHFWHASGWKDPRRPNAEIPQMSDWRLYGYGYYGRYYKVKTSFKKCVWVKEFLESSIDALRKSLSFIDLPTNDDH